MTRWLTSRGQALLLLLGVFASGTLSGIAIDRLWRRDRMADLGTEPSGGSPLDQLGLSPKQRARLDSVAMRFRPKTEAVLQEAFPRLRALTDSMDREIRANLTAAQQAKLDTLLAQRQTPVTRSLFSAPTTNRLSVPIPADSSIANRHSSPANPRRP